MIQPAEQQRVLTELRDELDKTTKKDAYDEAKFWNQAFVTNSQLCLQFLRSKHFDVKETAKMMISHFETKKRLFGGGEILAREILQSDLTPVELDLLRGGYLQLLPSRDASGRVVTVTNLSPLKGNSSADLERSMWYFSMATLRDDDTSKHGTVGVLYNFDDAQVDMSCFERLSQLEFCWPHRQLGAHIC